MILWHGRQHTFPSYMPSSHCRYLYSHFGFWCCHVDMILAQPSGMDGINCPIYWTLLTYAVWHMNTGQCPCRSSLGCQRHFYCLSCTLLYAHWLTTNLACCATCSSLRVTSWHHFIIRSCILRIITIELDHYGFPNKVCNRCSYDLTTWSEVFFDGLHGLCQISLINFRQHVWIFIHDLMPLLTHWQAHCTLVEYYTCSLSHN